MYHIAALLLFPFIFGLFLSLPLAIIQAIKHWFNSPSKRKEKAFFSNRFRYQWD